MPRLRSILDCCQLLTSRGTTETDTSDSTVHPTEASGLNEALTGLDPGFDRVEGKEQEIDRDAGYGPGLLVSTSE